MYIIKQKKETASPWLVVDEFDKYLWGKIKSEAHVMSKEDAEKVASLLDFEVEILDVQWQGQRRGLLPVRWSDWLCGFLYDATT